MGIAPSVRDRAETSPRTRRIAFGSVRATHCKHTEFEAASAQMAYRPDPVFQDVVQSYSGLISRIAYSYELDPGLREDLIQEMLMAIWRALPAFRDQSSLKTYVASIAQKRAITHVARRVRVPITREVSEDWADSEILPDEAAIATDQRRRLRDALQALTQAQRETALLMLEGMSFAEIGETLGISPNAATLRCQRAKAALIEKMD
eukprot:gene27246-30072_t